MGMVAPQLRIASAFQVFCGRFGDVSRYARRRGVCRQWVYREAHAVRRTLDEQPWRRRTPAYGSGSVRWRRSSGRCRAPGPGDRAG